MHSATSTKEEKKFAKSDRQIKQEAEERFQKGQKKWIDIISTPDSIKWMKKPFYT